jgi:hypothetical protein
MDAGLLGKFVIHLDVSRNKAEFLFDFSYDLEIGRAVEGVSSLMEKF